MSRSQKSAHISPSLTGERCGVYCGHLENIDHVFTGVGCISGGPKTIFVDAITGNSTSLYCGKSHVSLFAWGRCRVNFMENIGSRNENTVNMKNTRFGIRNQSLIIYNASKEYEGLYVCYNEEKILAKINLVVRLNGKGFVNYLLGIHR